MYDIELWTSDGTEQWYKLYEKIESRKDKSNVSESIKYGRNFICS